MKKLMIPILIILLGIIFYTPSKNESIKPKVEYYEVNITGEVTNPGVYKVPEKTSYKSATLMAGVTEESVYIESNDYIVKNTNIKVLKRENSIDINKASKKELMSVPSIGEKKANEIIKYRKNKKIEDYLELKTLLKINKNEQLLQIMAYTVIK